MLLIEVIVILMFELLCVKVGRDVVIRIVVILLGLMFLFCIFMFRCLSILVSEFLVNGVL